MRERLDGRNEDCMSLKLLLLICYSRENDRDIWLLVAIMKDLI